jgi:alkylhydroperoxidase family enzyme
MKETGRLRPRSAADTEGKNREILAALEARGEDLVVLRLLANSPNGLFPVVMMSNALMRRATLPPADREVAVLVLAVRAGNTYEWDEHVPISVAEGISDEQRAAIAAGGPVEVPLFSESQCLAAAFAEDLMLRRHLSPERWDAACATWGEAGALDLVMSTAFWGGLVPIMTAGLGLV